jgi:hypothetical protein
VTYIVECIVCSQPWEVPTMMAAVPGRQWLQVPEHGMLNLQTSEPTLVACLGIQHTAIGVGRRDEWERNWPLRKAARPIPKVLDGRPVEVITL